MRRLLLVILLAAPPAFAEEATAPPVPLLETKAELTGHKGWVRTLAFHPDGALLASGGPDRTLRIWDVEKEEQAAIHTLPRGG